MDRFIFLICYPLCRWNCCLQVKDTCALCFLHCFTWSPAYMRCMHPYWFARESFVFVRLYFKSFIFLAIRDQRSSSWNRGRQASHCDLLLCMLRHKEQKLTINWWHQSWSNTDQKFHQKYCRSLQRCVLHSVFVFNWIINWLEWCWF